MDFVRVDALDHRGISAGLLARQLARLDWSRLRSLADGLLDFAQDIRRKIRFGDPDRPEPTKAPAPPSLSPEAIRERMLAARATQPAPKPPSNDDLDPGFVLRP